MKKKNNAIDKFRVWKKMEERKIMLRVEEFKTDKGMEFLNGEFNQVYKDGVSHT